MYKKLTNYFETAKMKDKLSMTVKVICGVFLAAIVIAFVGLVSSNNNLIDFYYTPMPMPRCS